MDSSRGLIFDIQRYSMHDGPGIRTTVFMKGCPLHCRWCSNPESIKPVPEIMTNDLRCVRCGECARVCPEGAITIGAARRVDRARCNLCMKCVEVCRTGSLRVAGAYMTVGEVVSEVLKDQLFYKNSGGGVTISGGEPLFQPEFVRNLLRECKRQGISTAVDTSGFADEKVLESLFEFVDLFLFDVKHMDSAAHARMTGRGNERILRNARNAAKRVRTWVRVPLIPGYNDSKQAITDLATFAAEIGAEQVSLLPYHEWGKLKYRQLGRRYRMCVDPLDDGRVQSLARIIESHGLKAAIGH
jgi:pyruvate formate lyase activating enzyme